MQGCLGAEGMLSVIISLGKPARRNVKTGPPPPNFFWGTLKKTPGEKKGGFFFFFWGGGGGGGGGVFFWKFLHPDRQRPRY